MKDGWNLVNSRPASNEEIVSGLKAAWNDRRAGQLAAVFVVFALYMSHIKTSI